MGKKTSHKIKFDTPLPYFLNKELLDFLASRREKNTTKEEKFTYLIERDIKNLLISSIDEKRIGKKTQKKYKKKLNTLLRDFAILTLNETAFVKDILDLAKINGLWDIKYELDPEDFYTCHSSPVLNAWERRLQYLSLIYLSMKFQKNADLQKLFVNTYLPPQFEQKVVALMDKYGLEFFWYESVVHLLLTGLWYLPRNASVIQLHLSGMSEDKPISGHSTLSLEIYSITSQEEVGFRWKEIESLKKELFPSIKERLKPKDIREVFEAKFGDGVEKLAENKRKNKKSIPEYSRNLVAINKRMDRAVQSHKEFWEKYKKIPNNVWRQIYHLKDWSLQSIYFF